MSAPNPHLLVKITLEPRRHYGSGVIDLTLLPDEAENLIASNFGQRRMWARKQLSRAGQFTIANRYFNITVSVEAK